MKILFLVIVSLKAFIYIDPEISVKKERMLH